MFISEQMAASAIQTALDGQPHARYGDLGREKASIPYSDIVALSMLLQFLLDEPSPVGAEMRDVAAQLQGRLAVASGLARERLGMLPEDPPT